MGMKKSTFDRELKLQLSVSGLSLASIPPPHGGWGSRKKMSWGERAHAWPGSMVQWAPPSCVPIAHAKVKEQSGRSSCREAIGTDRPTPQQKGALVLYFNMAPGSVLF